MTTFPTWMDIAFLGLTVIVIVLQGLEVWYKSTIAKRQKQILQKGKELDWRGKSIDRELRKIERMIEDATRRPV